MGTGKVMIDANHAVVLTSVAFVSRDQFAGSVPVVWPVRRRQHTEKRLNRRIHRNGDIRWGWRWCRRTDYPRMAAILDGRVHQVPWQLPWTPVLGGILHSWQRRKFDFASVALQVQRRTDCGRTAGSDWRLNRSSSSRRVTRPDTIPTRIREIG